MQFSQRVQFILKCDLFKIPRKGPKRNFWVKMTDVIDTALCVDMFAIG